MNLPNFQRRVPFSRRPAPFIQATAAGSSYKKFPATGQVELLLTPLPLVQSSGDRSPL